MKKPNLEIKRFRQRLLKQQQLDKEVEFKYLLKTLKTHPTQDNLQKVFDHIEKPSRTAFDDITDHFLKITFVYE
jgi:hypothetical protein